MRTFDISVRASPVRRSGWPGARSTKRSSTLSTERCRPTSRRLPDDADRDRCDGDRDRRRARCSRTGRMDPRRWGTARNARSRDGQVDRDRNAQRTIDRAVRLFGARASSAAASSSGSTARSGRSASMEALRRFSSWWSPARRSRRCATPDCGGSEDARERARRHVRRDNLPPPALWPEFAFTLAQFRYPLRLNCATDLLDAMVAAGFGERPAARTPSRRLTYRELLHEANRIARVSSDDMGLVPGNRVLLRDYNDATTAACWFGTARPVASRLRRCRFCAARN